MKVRTLLALLLVFSSTFACANKPSTQETAQFIVAFNDSDTYQNALKEKSNIIAKWQDVTDSHIEFVRTLSGHSWVVSVTTPSKVSFIETLQSLETIKYVEEDQVIQISPIERPAAPSIRVH